MNRFVVPLAVFALLAVVLALGVRHAPEKGTIASPLIGKPAPQFTLPSLADPQQQVSSAGLKGHWYLLNVWGTWCYACRAEHETLLEMRDTHTVPLIGLDWKDDDARAHQWLTELGNPYQAVALDHNGRTAIDFGVYGAPETFLIDPAGIVVYKHVGPLTREVWTREIQPRLPALRAAGS